VKKTPAPLTAIVLFTLSLLPFPAISQERLPKPFDPPPPGHFEAPENKDGKPKGWTVKLYRKEHDGAWITSRV